MIKRGNLANSKPATAW